MKVIETKYMDIGRTISGGQVPEQDKVSLIVIQKTIGGPGTILGREVRMRVLAGDAANIAVAILNQCPPAVLSEKNCDTLLAILKIKGREGPRVECPERP